MLTGKTALTFWDRFARLSPTYLRSADGRKITAKVVRMIRKNDGKGEARTFLHLLYASEAAGF